MCHDFFQAKFSAINKQKIRVMNSSLTRFNLSDYFSFMFSCRRVRRLAKPQQSAMRGELRRKAATWLLQLRQI